MSYKIISKGKNLSKDDLSDELAKIEIWFDHCLKLWAVQFFNSSGYQLVGDSYETDYASKKAHAIDIAKKHNVIIRIESRKGTKFKNLVPIGNGKFKQTIL